MIGDRDTAFPSTVPHRAVLDIGSNTVRLVVYGGAQRAPTALLNERVTARLGAELLHSGRIPEGAIGVALQGLRRYRRILTDLQIEDVDVIATAAARLAENGPAFLDQVRACGFEPLLLSGEEEARTSAMGVIGAFPGARGVVADLGGGSLELVEIRDGQCTHGVSLPLGALMLGELRAEGPHAFKHKIAKALKHEDWAHAMSEPLYMVGGTWRALASYAMEQLDHPLTDPHGFELEGKEALRLAKRMRDADPARLDLSRISEMRAGMLPDAAALLCVLLGKLEPPKLIFSSWGLREGRLYDRLDGAARAQDPLLAGVASFCAPRGGPPTLATQIAGWTVDALPRGGRGSERVRLAATMLALASMQIEPNLRVRQAINWALYKRWMDLDDGSRAMLAAAVSANCGVTELPKQLYRLSDARMLDEALCWGLAIRLARRLGGGSRRSLRNTALAISGKKLVLYLGESHADLWADHVEQDLANLAARLGLKPTYRVVPNDDLLGQAGLGIQVPELEG
ncbi:MAG: Ppx/GppA family phosphatase [Candidatus Andeanibacterium colombiense]|uniref:Ppx/GppA family phosphatase n=1 Tax=Candidatus Andeanibacterium colombiense TaxID=3121345 RepID=A0AAJ5X7H4_9SPHN|nr:MAG: Ppx/GppA family phosphatase [Sphingomonadaceae bacterium]